MKTNTIKLASLGLSIAFYLGSGAMVTAQEQSFDDTDLRHAMIESTIYNGKQAYKNGYGEVIEQNRVYEMSTQDQMDRGFTIKVTSSGPAQLRSEDAESGTSFNLTFLDVVNNTDRGFDDPQLGETRRNLLAKAFAYYSGIINDVGQADIEIQESSQTGAAFATSASYYFSSAGFNEALVTRHITSGFDPAGGIPDGYIKFNFGYNYSYSLTSEPSGTEYDFYTVALHEILHVLGFSSFCGPNGTSQAPSANVYTDFDKYLMIVEGQPFFIVSGSGPQAVVSPANPNYVTNNQMLFEAQGGVYAPVHSPATYGGSSIDHFDNSRSNNGEYLMNPSLGKGKRIRNLNENEAFTLAQLGYAIDFSLATSINEVNLNITAAIFPNPAVKNGAVKVNIGGGIGNKEILVVVYDMMGRQAYSKVVITEGDGVFTAIDPYHNLAPGMYIVIGSAKDELFNQKLMILGEEPGSGAGY